MAFPTNATVIDNFNRAAIGANWTTGSFFGDGALAIISSIKLGSAGGSFPGGYYNASAYGPDTEVYADIVESGGEEIALFLRCSADNSPVSAYIYKGNMGTSLSYIARIDSGSETVLGAKFTRQYANGDKIGFEAIGSTLAAYIYTAGAWAQITTRSDGTHTGANRVAVELQNVNATIDNLSGGTVVAAGGTILPQMIQQGLYTGGAR
jgi:hypothetical protein